jgi:drug/metabolite transporter (DMT)-like permease
MKRRKLAIAVACYVSTAVGQPLIADMINARLRVENSLVLMPHLCMTIAMALVAIVRQRRSEPRKAPTAHTTHAVVVSAMLDILAGRCLYAGLARVGGGLFTVIYSSCTAWTALFSHFAGNRLHLYQWVGVGVVTLGLVCSGLANLGQPAELDGVRLAWGFGLCVLGSMLHSILICYMNARLQDSRVSLCAMEFCAVMGAMETAVLVLTGAASFAVASPGVSFHRADANALASLLLALIGCNWVHAIAFFLTLTDAGPVFSALLKAIQMVCVFALSALFFCSLEQPTQCATIGKCFTVMLLAAGLGLYALGSAAQRTSNRKAERAAGV